MEFSYFWAKKIFLNPQKQGLTVIMDILYCFTIQTVRKSHLLTKDRHCATLCYHAGNRSTMMDAICQKFLAKQWFTVIWLFIRVL